MGGPRLVLARHGEGGGLRPGVDARVGPARPLDGTRSRKTSKTAFATAHWTVRSSTNPSRPVSVSTTLADGAVATRGELALPAVKVCAFIGNCESVTGHANGIITDGTYAKGDLDPRRSKCLLFHRFRGTNCRFFENTDLSICYRAKLCHYALKNTRLGAARHRPTGGRNMVRATCIIAVAVACAGAQAGFTTIDFSTDDSGDPLVNGQDIMSPDEFGALFSVSSGGPNLGAAIFDSDPMGPNMGGPDPDLLVGLGNVMMLQSSLLAHAERARDLRHPQRLVRGRRHYVRLRRPHAHALGRPDRHERRQRDDDHAHRHHGPDPGVHGARELVQRRNERPARVGHARPVRAYRRRTARDSAVPRRSLRKRVSTSSACSPSSSTSSARVRSTTSRSCPPPVPRRCWASRAW